MGYNGARKHQKFEDPRYLYWADKLGLLVWSELLSAYWLRDSEKRNMMRDLSEAIKRDYNHPCLMRYDGRFYLYCSSGGLGIKCWVSEDMIRFDYQGFVCTDEHTIGAYAPEVAYNAGKFWMVTSPRGSGRYLLVADSPLEPFEVVSDKLGVSIDGSIFVDDDGLLLEYTDPMPLTAGRVGFSAHTDGLGFEAVEVVEA